MASLLDVIKHYQHNIEKYPNDEHRVLKCIDKLFNLDVKVHHLQETGVGRTVNALRKEPGEVGQAARALVYKWKVMVASEESDQEGDVQDSTPQNGYGGDSQGNSSGSKHDKSDTTPKSDHSHHNGNSSGSKRKYQSSEEEEPNTKKSKHHNSNGHDDSTSQQVKIKKEESESESASDESQSDSDSESESEEDIKPDRKIKIEPSDTYETNTAKQTTYDHVQVKKEPLSPNRSNEKEKHSKSRIQEPSRNGHEQMSPVKKEKHHSTHKEKSSKDKESSSDKKHKSEHKSSEKDKSKEEKHKSSSHRSESSSKHKSHSDKSASKSEKSSSSKSHRDESDKHKSSSEKEDRHKSRDKSSSSKDKDKEKSSREKSSSHKSDRKHSSEKTKSDSRSGEKKEERSPEKKSHKSSSSSSHKIKTSSSSSKSKEAIPKKGSSNKGNSDDDGIDCGSGASFADALGMIPNTKSKKKSTPIKDAFSPNTSANTDLSPAALLAPTVKLAPLPSLEISALPEISPNYRPRPPPKFLPHFTDEDPMCAVISSKNQRTKVYSGNKVVGKVPSLYEMCVQILQEHIDALEYTGGVPYEILKPVVDRATPQQLFVLEHYNPYLMEDTDHLWQKHCEKNFRNKKRQEMETWREMYMRCQEEQEHKLKSLTENIRLTQEAKKAPIKQTKMAYVDTVVKPPRNIARKQALHGTAQLAAASPAGRVAALAAGPGLLAAGRVAALAAGPGLLRGGVRPPPAVPVSSTSFNKPKKAPLMQKALQFMRGRKR